jgi:hypothetical protein
MKIENFILNILRKIESLKDGMIAYAYLDGNALMSHTWYLVCLNDYEMYMNDKRLKALMNAWHKAGKALGIKVIFAYCNPSEEKLNELAEKDNLFLNV